MEATTPDPGTLFPRDQRSRCRLRAGVGAAVGGLLVGGAQGCATRPGRCSPPGTSPLAPAGVAGAQRRGCDTPVGSSRTAAHRPAFGHRGGGRILEARGLAERRPDPGGPAGLADRDDRARSPVCSTRSGPPLGAPKPERFLRPAERKRERGRPRFPHLPVAQAHGLSGTRHRGGLAVSTLADTLVTVLKGGAMAAAGQDERAEPDVLRRAGDARPVLILDQPGRRPKARLRPDPGHHGVRGGGARARHAVRRARPAGTPRAPDRGAVATDEQRWRLPTRMTASGVTRAAGAPRLARTGQRGHLPHGRPAAEWHLRWRGF